MRSHERSVGPRTEHRRRRFTTAIAAIAAALAASGAGKARAEDHKFALSMLHFNVQYVAGGLNGFFITPNPELDLSAAQVEDNIIRQSFEPVLDLFAKHPTWGIDLEMQGYMLDVMAERHGDVLDKLRALAEAGQAEVVSFHYSDQLFLAYPREDWVRSQALTAAAFAKHGIPLGKTVFCQEGQAGPGMAAAMEEAGYQTLLFPKNLFGYQHGHETPIEPLYRFGNIDLLFSRGTSWQGPSDSIEVDFWFVDDGELLATGDFDPYIAEFFFEDEAAVAEKEAELLGLEAAGYRIATVGEYVQTIRPLLEARPQAPPLLDGTWQPDTTDGIARWLGGSGIWADDERDNDVRSLGALAHRELVAAETAAAAAGLDARGELDGAWRLLVLGQVTDASGINPFRGEIEYGLAHASEVLRIAREVLLRAHAVLSADGTPLSIDTAAGTVTPAGPSPAAPPEVEPQLALGIEPGNRDVEERWWDLGGGAYRVMLRFGPSIDERSIAVTFPGQAGEGGDLVYTPGLAEAPVQLARDGFLFDHFQLALSDGLIGLGPGAFVIKDMARVHIAATVRRDSGDVRFQDDTAPYGQDSTWVFQVVLGDQAQAAAAARALNVLPTVRR
ncbi:MAG: hypothetical protein WKG00_33010 [Polyangiaceae bacterium]